MPQDKVKIGWVLRDMMQSTGIWTFKEDAIVTLVNHASTVGFSSLEIGGGQSYQISLQQGYNPYSILKTARTAVEQCEKKIPLQILLRGANQLGFKHYPSSLQQQNIDLLVEAGSGTTKDDALIIRNFDALNDAENLKFSIDYMVRKDLAAAVENEAATKAGDTPTAKRLHVQAALSYVRPADSQENSCYSTKYYVNYAKALIEIAKEAGGSLDSLCIKDMSGQLAPDAARDLVPALKALGLPVFLHCHSTDEAKATATQLIAVESGIDGIEVAVAPLAGGTSHNDVRNLCYSNQVVALDLPALETLEASLSAIFNDTSQRQDLDISLGALKRMVAIGVPGGAIPFILNDLKTQICKMLSVDLEQALDMFEQEVTSIQSKLGPVPLVTPTADIVAKQAINNLANNVRPAAYRVIDPRFCSLVLGYYGDVNNYATGTVVEPDQTLVDDIDQYCEAITPNADGRRFHAGSVYPNPGRLVDDIHPTTLAKEEDYDLVEDYVGQLFKRYPGSCSNYGTEQQCFVLHIMRPAGKTDRLLTHNILGPTEERLRKILEATLSHLPAMDIPESRDRNADESTDQLLLDALGDYEGVVSSIKDLVLAGNSDSIRSRVDERTAFKLERIIAFTLRKRHIEGRGQAAGFLS